MPTASPNLLPLPLTTAYDLVGAGPYLEALPSWNNDYNGEGNLDPILSAMAAISLRTSVFEDPRIREPGVAAQLVQDLDMFPSSAKRIHPTEDPLSKTPGYGAMMVEAGNIAAETDGWPKIPRMILESNFRPRRLSNGELSMFTGKPGERVFIQQLNTGYMAMRGAVDVLSRANLREDSTEALVRALALTGKAAMTMLRATGAANRTYKGYDETGEKKVPFGIEHQPFFKPLLVEGTVVAPSNGAQGPQKEAELFLRAIDGDMGVGGDASAFAHFYVQNIPYTPRFRRQEIERYVETNGELSLFRYIQELPRGERREELGRAYIQSMASFGSFSQGHNRITADDIVKRSADNKIGGGGSGMEELIAIHEERKANVDAMKLVLGNAA